MRCRGRILSAAGLAAIRHRSGEPRQTLPATVGADVQTCAACHGDLVDDFRRSPHFNTLHTADDAVVRERLLSGALESDGVHPRFAYELADGKLFLTSDGERLSYPTTYVFGSGRHGHTPVATRTNERGETELLENSLSWYPSGGLNLTIGRDEEEVYKGWNRFGHPMDSEETEDCFRCHTAELKYADSALDLVHLTLGRRCNTCHANLEEHVATQGESLRMVNTWPKQTPRESIRRCGACHRSLETVHLDEWNADDKNLTRFAPIGLELCRCFERQSELRPDCLTCHNPHEEPRGVDETSLDACRNCHTGSEQVHCPNQPATSDCWPATCPRSR